ncbi:stalk domain-containing protein [Paenibacillus sp.]|uniref:stalk domain-containing protein n=1 Tax=Paenibacillus sp. TaxID=58172 RepID=UPI002811A64D|nr:stalk domain-containing protein [Paenibacillus sp.]
MRRKSVLLLVFLLALPSSTAAAQDVPPTLTVDGETILSSPPPLVVDGVMLVPVRKLLESIGATVEWDREAREVVGTKLNRSIRILPDAEVLIAGGDAEVSLKNQVKIIDGTLYSSLRALSAGFGAEVTWDEGSRSASVKTSLTSVDDEDLTYIMERIIDQMEELQDESGFVPLSGWSVDGQVEIVFRKYGEHEARVSPEQLNEMQRSIFRVAGAAFPLNLHQFAIPEEADIEGVITKIDERTNRILIENPDRTVGETNDPEAVWISLTDDAVVNYNGDTTRLEVGLKVRAWFVGLMATSYPGQTQSVKLEVL